MDVAWLRTLSVARPVRCGYVGHVSKKGGRIESGCAHICKQSLTNRSASGESVTSGGRGGRMRSAPSCASAK